MTPRTTLKGAIVKKIFITYGTTEGQTAKIAEFISDVLRDHGHDVAMVDVNDAAGTVADGYNAVIVGASIHMGRHDKHVIDFVRKNRDTLARMPSAFFSVSLAAHGDTAEAEGYVEQFEQETGWQPDKVALFGVALLYTQYGFIKRRPDEEDRPRQAWQPRRRPFPRLRLHRVGRCEALRRALRH